MEDQSQSFLSAVFRPGPTRERPPLSATGRAGRNLPAAVTTGAVLVAVIAVALFVYPPLFIGVIAVACLAGVWELAGAFARMGVSVAVVPLYVGVIGMVTCAWLLGAEGMLFAMYLTVFVCAAWRLLDARTESRMSDIASSAFVAVYVPFLAAFVVLMVSAWPNPWVFLSYEAMVIASDTGGWAAGIAIGRHPMAPRLSPKKSWEGFAGSCLAAMGVGCLGLHLLGAQWWWGLVAGVLVAFVGTMGDLTESLIKREAGIKDMSGLLPGHGGVLDRVDAVLMTAPVVYFVYALALPGVSWEGSH